MRILFIPIFALLLPSISFGLRPELFEKTEIVRDEKPSAKVCELRSRYLKSALENKISFSAVLDRATASGKKIVLFGESHFERAEKFYLWAFREMKKRNPAFDCLIVEQSKKKFGAALEACNTNLVGCDREKLPDFSGVNQGYEAGLKVKAVDDPPNIFGMPEDLLSDVSRRDRYMADASGELFEKGECTRAFMIVGANHARTQSRETAVTVLLKEKNLEPYRIELFSPNTNRLGCTDYRWQWKSRRKKVLCEGVALLNENFAFLNSKDGESVPSEYGNIPGKGGRYELYGNWADFDAAIAIGCEDPGANVCDPPAEECADF